MTEWRDAMLGDVIELKRGYDLPAAMRRPGNIPIVSSSGRSGYHDEAKVRGPGVVTGRYGTLGNVYFIEEDFWPLNTALYVRDFKGNDPRFIAGLLESLELRASDVAAAVPGVNRNHLHRLPVRIPNLAIQRKISWILDGLDEFIENNLRRIELLEQMAQSIYREWFVHFRYPGHAGGKLGDTPFGAIPEYWTLTTVGRICSRITKSVWPQEVPSDTPAVGLEHIPRKSLTLREWGLSQELASRKTVFDGGDVLFGKIRPYFHKVSLAPVAGICSTDVIVLRAARLELSSLATMTVFSDEFIAHAVQTSNGTKMPRANWNVLRDWVVPLPPNPLLARFEELVGSLLSQSAILAAGQQVTGRLRDLLLPKLLTGEIEVSKLDLDAMLEGAVL
jgi:type I restriction enzyme, S subunit